MEIARSADDEAEALLRSPRTRFLIPLPSLAVRALIEARRARTITAPQHENEAHDAPPDLLRALWLDLHEVAQRLGLAAASAGAPPYSPETYERLYRHLLRHRQAQALPIDEPLQPTASVYDQLETLPNLRATAAQAEAALAALEASMTPAQAFAGLDSWYEV